MCIVVLSIILFLILVNSFVLEKYYQYTKSNQLKSLYNNINDYYNSDNPATNFKDELDRVAIKNNFDIIIKDENDKRSNKIYLNDKAKDVREGVLDVLNDWNKEITKSLTEEEEEMLKSLLEKVCKNINV